MAVLGFGIREEDFDSEREFEQEVRRTRPQRATGAVLALGVAWSAVFLGGHALRTNEGKPRVQGVSLAEPSLQEMFNNDNGGLNYWRSGSTMDHLSAHTAMDENAVSSGYYLIFQADGTQKLMGIDEIDDPNADAEENDAHNRVFVIDLPQGVDALEAVQAQLDEGYYSKFSLGHTMLEVTTFGSIDKGDTIVPLGGRPQLLGRSGVVKGSIPDLDLYYEVDMDQMNREILATGGAGSGDPAHSFGYYTTGSVEHRPTQTMANVVKPEMSSNGYNPNP